MLDDFPELEETISRMKAAGLLIEYSKNVLDINPYVEPFIINHLIKSDIL